MLLVQHPHGLIWRQPFQVGLALPVSIIRCPAITMSERACRSIAHWTSTAPESRAYTNPVSSGASASFAAHWATASISAGLATKRRWFWSPIAGSPHGRSSRTVPVFRGLTMRARRPGFHAAGLTSPPAWSPSLFGSAGGMTSRRHQCSGKRDLLSVGPRSPRNPSS